MANVTAGGELSTTPPMIFKDFKNETACSNGDGCFWNIYDSQCYDGNCGPNSSCPYPYSCTKDGKCEGICKDFKNDQPCLHLEECFWNTYDSKCYDLNCKF